MSVSVQNAVASLRAPSRIEDAEPLWLFLQARRREGVPARVDPSGSGPLHTAVLQLLLAFRPAMAAPLEDPFQRRWVAPLLEPPQHG